MILPFPWRIWLDFWYVGWEPFHHSKVWTGRPILHEWCCRKCWWHKRHEEFYYYIQMFVSLIEHHAYEQFDDNYASGSVLVDRRHDNTPHKTTKTSNLYLEWVEVHLEKAVTYVMKDQLCCPRLSTQHTQGLFTSSRGLNENRIPCCTSEVKWG